MKIYKSDVVIAIDVETCFMPGGSLPVEDGDAVVDVGLSIMELFQPQNRFATCDRHGIGHISFASSYRDAVPYKTVLTFDDVRDWTKECLSPKAAFSLHQLHYYLYRAWSQRLWPEHGLIGTSEADLHPKLLQCPLAYVQYKGMDAACDSYSAWATAIGRPTGLGDRVRGAGAKRCFLWGLALDYCVMQTAADAANDGFEVIIILDASRAVDASKAGMEKLFRILARLNISVIYSSDLTKGQ